MLSEYVFCAANAELDEAAAKQITHNNVLTMEVNGFDSLSEGTDAQNALIYLADSGTLQNVAMVHHGLDTGTIVVLNDQTSVKFMDSSPQSEKDATKEIGKNQLDAEIIIAVVGGGLAASLLIVMAAWKLHNCKQRTPKSYNIADNPVYGDVVIPETPIPQVQYQVPATPAPI